jgi:hypothetical protein
MHMMVMHNGAPIHKAGQPTRIWPVALADIAAPPAAIFNASRATAMKALNAI